jgi:hypothetical protein
MIQPRIPHALPSRRLMTGAPNRCRKGPDGNCHGSLSHPKRSHDQRSTSHRRRRAFRCTDEFRDGCRTPATSRFVAHQMVVSVPRSRCSAARSDNSTALARDESRNDASGNVATPASSNMSDLARYRSEASPDARASIAFNYLIYRMLNERDSSGERDK